VPVPCFLLFLCFRKVTQEIFSELDETNTSEKKAIGGALFWLMRGAYGMRHHCHATSNNLSVAHFNIRQANYA
jgi:hypothetical protein